MMLSAQSLLHTEYFKPAGPQTHKQQSCRILQLCNCGSMAVQSHGVLCRVPQTNADAATLLGSRLEQLASIPLAGLVESIAVLRGRSSSQKDALLLTFRSAPMCMHACHCSTLHVMLPRPPGLNPWLQQVFMPVLKIQVTTRKH